MTRSLVDAGYWPVVRDALMQASDVVAVMHFASWSRWASRCRTRPGNSTAMIITTMWRNTCACLPRWCAMHAHLLFSSTAAIFGEPEYVPIDAQHPKAPLNPYGRSKWMVGPILADFDRAGGLRSSPLHYPNAAGADPDALSGECPQPHTHLIALVPR